MSYPKRQTVFAAEAGTPTSPWFLVGDLDNLNLIVVVSATATIVVEGSNDDGQVAAITNVAALSESPISATGEVDVTPVPRYIRFDITATTGTVDLDFFGIAGD